MKQFNVISVLTLSLLVMTACTNQGNNAEDNNQNNNDASIFDSERVTESPDTSENTSFENTSTDNANNSAAKENQNQDTDMTTYTNDKWGFSVGFPQGYEAKIDNEKDSELNFSIRKQNDTQEAENTDGVCTNCTLRLQVLKNFIGGPQADEKNKDPEAWLTAQKALGMDYSETTIGGETAYSRSDQNGKTAYLIFKENGDRYDRYDIRVKNTAEADKILSTFKLES